MLTNASYFVAYELSKTALTPAGADPSQLNLGAVIVAGGMAGVAMWTLAIPPDVCFTLRLFFLMMSAIKYGVVSNTILGINRLSSPDCSRHHKELIQASWTVRGS